MLQEVPMRCSRNWCQAAVMHWRPAFVALGVLAMTILLQAPAGALPADSDKFRYSRAARDTKAAVSWAIGYSNDKGVYPKSLQVLREAGYGNFQDKDPWGNDYVLSPVLVGGRRPQAGDEVYVYSRGPKGTGTYSTPSSPDAFISDTGENGSVGYSTVYGSWTGKPAGAGWLIDPCPVISLLFFAVLIAYLIGLFSYGAGRAMRRTPSDLKELSRTGRWLRRVLLLLFILLTMCSGLSLFR